MAARDERVHPLQMALAAGAVVATVPVLLWTVTSHLLPLFVLTALSVAIPLFLPRRPPAFARAAAILALGLLALGLPGFLFGMFLFWPSALLLLLAAFADPHARPVSARIMGAAGGLALAWFLAAFGSFYWHCTVAPALAEPHTYRAVSDPDTFYADLGKHDAHLKRFGATSVTGTASEDLLYLAVRFPDDLPEERRAALKRELEKLPGVSRVDLCPVRDCG
ncbi:hypothetical protein [Streptomyces lavendofoliae]|uniref:Uncharacterized protein n=1 Tax=Streptomyces lavendofoliae TaxID=67314 RepID=A0A918M3Q2_9ACTN|nr:hypothetical protein [Streptomyces lavendofoliae]GGU32568.1 hypothetical protein GCM10010274_19450 [Streptomyces lavendofoliae]